MVAGSLPATSLALILRAFTAPVAPACRVNPTASRTTPMRKSHVRAEQDDADTGHDIGRSADNGTYGTTDDRWPVNLSRRETRALYSHQTRGHGDVSEHHDGDRRCSSRR